MLATLLTEDGFPVRKKCTTEYSSPCPSPVCDSDDDGFVINAKTGRGYCRKCNWKGDDIQYLREFRGMGFQQAAKYTGRTVDRKGTKDWPDKKERLTGTICSTNKALWREQASTVINKARHNLLDNKSSILKRLLRERGLKIKTIKRFNLGWISKDTWTKKADWGIPTDGKDLLLPAGLVIPYDNHRIRIRRDNPDYGKYWVVKGSNLEPMIINPTSSLPLTETPAIVVESELDAMLLAQDLVSPYTVIALGSTNTKISNELSEDLKQRPFILVALDSDEAGEIAAKRDWTSKYVTAFRTPVSTSYGKDFGEAYVNGLDVNDWLFEAVELMLDTAVAQTSGEENTYPPESTVNNETTLPI
ncbi:toprim domain-containing protein [Desulfogranum marinum]|uniref:toprim domain-containing protein n=1 Tax=Desulfogranum marinum TaxID=453220 RepID=UPI0019660707|nr:toprim domain-containing protein [Desulfogranum marinum]MBM9515213.1 toprim domain-containing protein [Desulfogranum marinum]